MSLCAILFWSRISFFRLPVLFWRRTAHTTLSTIGVDTTTAVQPKMEEPPVPANANIQASAYNMPKKINLALFASHNIAHAFPDPLLGLVFAGF